MCRGVCISCDPVWSFITTAATVTYIWKAAHLFHPPISRGFRNLSAPLHPIISRHFIEHSRSGGLCLFTAPNNPPAAAPGSVRAGAQWLLSEQCGGDECLHICGRFPQQITPTRSGFRCFPSHPTAVREVGKVVLVHSHIFHKQYYLKKNDIAL